MLHVMNAFLATTLAATLLLAAVLPGRSSTEPTDDPPPVECPLCGGNVRVHFLIIATLTATQAEVGRRVLVGLF